MATDTNNLKNNTQFRRRYMTFVRMVRYGVNNFSRNAWLTTAATAVMTITLIIILTSFLTQHVFDDTITTLRKKVDISIFLKKDVSDDAVKTMQSSLEKLPNVASVRYITSDEAQKLYNQQNVQDAELLKQLGDIEQDTGSLLPSSFRIQVRDLGKINELKTFVDHDATFRSNINTTAKPTYGDNQGAIDNIARTAVFAERAGLFASILFVVISSLIIFNTIRMAIFNRREEIQMMKLIGADRSFIRGPFIVEAVMYGFFAALIATGSVYLVMVLIQDKLSQYGISVGPTIAMMDEFPGLILLGTIIAGALLGVLSSQMAVRRNLKV